MSCHSSHTDRSAGRQTVFLFIPLRVHTSASLNIRYRCLSVEILSVLLELRV